MQELIIRLLIFSLVILSLSSHGKLVDSIKNQYAGEIGFLSVGIGQKFSENYSLDYFYGYLPARIGGVQIETFALKNNLNHINFEFRNTYHRFYSAITMYHVTGINYQTSRDSSYPQEYYRLGSIRALFALGLATTFKPWFNYLEFYFESGINDIVLTNYLNNSDVYNPFDYVSHALGVKYEF